MLRVCWLTNVPLPSACQAVGREPPVAGGWLSALGEAMVATGQVKLQVITPVIGKGGTVTDADGTTHALLDMEPRQFIQDVLHYPGAALRTRYLEAMAPFQPQIVHVNGTEYSHGLLAAEGDTTLPTVVSLQGFVGACQRYDCAGIPLWERVWNCGPKGILHPANVWRGTSLGPQRVHNEEQILRSPAIFVGRTTFDRAYLHAVNPSARYCHCDEALRGEFFRQERDRNAVVPHCLFAPDSSSPRKGFHCLLKAVALLKQEFPDIVVRVPGSGPRDSWRSDWYERYLRKLMRRLDLEGRLVFLGELSADAMAAELARAHVVGYPSFVDNSPNALGEAMLVGAPIVTSYVGGIPSMVRDGENALCFPAGDEISMAGCIRTLFQDDALAQHLAENARRVARVRHDPQRIAPEMLTIYRRALGEVA